MTRSQSGTGRNGAGRPRRARGDARPSSRSSRGPGRRGSRSSAAGPVRPRRCARASKSIPILTARGCRSEKTASIWRATRRVEQGLDGGDLARVLRGGAGQDGGAVDPCAAKVSRSAWIPAPPPESEAAMETATTGRRGAENAVASRRGTFAPLVIKSASHGHEGSPDDHAGGRREARPRGATSRDPCWSVRHLLGCGGTGFRISVEENAPDEGRRFEASGIPVVMDEYSYHASGGSGARGGPDPAGDGYRLDHPDAVMTTFC